ncbi:MAG: hypothetical protein WAT12_12295 [Candidatus Nitrotoga sp.]
MAAVFYWYFIGLQVFSALTQKAVSLVPKQIENLLPGLLRPVELNPDNPLGNLTSLPL